MERTFRHSAGFSKRIEFWLIGKMMKEGLDVYVPLVDDFGIDAVIRKSSGEFVELQIKASSMSVKFGAAALFAAIGNALNEQYIIPLCSAHNHSSFQEIFEINVHVKPVRIGRQLSCK